MKLENKISIITGGTRGIGFATVKDFLAEGATVVLCGSTQESADRAVAKIKSEAPDAKVEGMAPCITDYESVNAAVDAVVEKYGRLDVVANIAGITDFEPIEHYTVERFKHIMDVNVVGSFNFCLAASKHMTRQGSGVLLLSSSTTSIVGSCGGVAYGTSKFAVNGLMTSLARELGPKGIRVNAVLPGWIATDMVTSLPDEIIKPQLAKLPMGRMAAPEECAKPYVFLASDDASWCTCTILECDGASRFAG